MIKNEKGFTLIELVVVLVISVILMGVAGSVFLSSTGFFSKITISDQDKLATDKVAEFVVDEVKYSTDLVVSNEKLTKENLKLHGISDIENWHYFYIDKANGRLYHDSVDTPALNESYYTNRKLVVTARKYEFYRLDLKFTFIGNSNEEEYNTMSTIVLPNMELKYESDSDAISKTPFDGNEVNSANPGEGSNGLFIYYKKEGTVKDSNIIDKASGGGTIAEQLKTCHKINDKDDEYIPGKEYIKGAFVWAMKDGKKTWYRCTPRWGNTDSTDPRVSNNGSWKLVYIENSEPSEGTFYNKSNYYQGDVVRYFEKGIETDFIYYYKFEMYNSASDDFPNSRSDLKRWAPVYINVYQSQENLCDMDSVSTGKGEINDYVNHSFVYNSPYAKLYNEDERLNLNPFKSDVAFYEYKDSYSVTNTKIIPSSLNAKTLTNEMVIKYKDDLYINVSPNAINPAETKPGQKKNNEYVWQKLQVSWDAKSSYVNGDVVFYDNNLYMCTFKSITDGSFPTAKGWQVVYWDTKSRTYMNWLNGKNY